MGNAVTNPGRTIEKTVFGVKNREDSIFVDQAEERRRREARESYARQQQQAAEQARLAELRRQQAEAAERERKRVEEARRRRQEQERANQRALEAERQRKEAERRRLEEQRRQQAIQNHRNEFNSYSNNLADLERQISSKQQEQRREEKMQGDLTRQRDEERAVVAKFSQERSNVNLARIVLVGETGVGKSTLANRFIGDVSPYCDGASAVFRVSNGILSETARIQKETRSVRLANGASKTISVIDTPGLSDSQNRDRHHANLLCEYLRGVERVHSFVIVLSSANPRLDDATIDGLKRMTNMFGRGFWAFVTIVYTNVDDAPTRARFTRNASDLQTRLQLEFGLREEASLNVLAVGFDDWEGSVRQVIEGANAGKYYTCDSLKSPLQQLENSVAQQARKVQSVKNEISTLNSRASTVRGNREGARASLRSYGVTV